MSTRPNKINKPQTSVRQAARQDAFKYGIALLKQAKSIDDPESRSEAEKAAVRYFIKDAIIPLTPQFVLTFVTVITVLEVATCIIAILKLPFGVSSVIIVITACFWFILVAIALALGKVFSEAVLAKIMTSTFGKLIEKVSFWKSQ